MVPKKLLIADGNEDLAAALCDALQGAYQVRVTQDGKEALALLESFRPDVLVLDLMLPSLDGITLLQDAASAGLCPKVLALSRFFNDYTLEMLTALGVGYIMRKPCQLHALIARIGDLGQRIHPLPPPQPDPKTRTANILISLGFGTKWHGYKYLKEAVVIFSQEPGLSMTKELYPAVAALLHTEWDLVERSIRNAIGTAWLRRDDQVWQLYFPPGPDGVIPKPTNANFISRLAEAIRMP